MMEGRNEYGDIVGVKGYWRVGVAMGTTDGERGTRGRAAGRGVNGEGTCVTDLIGRVGGDAPRLAPGNCLGGAT